MIPQPKGERKPTFLQFVAVYPPRLRLCICWRNHALRWSDQMYRSPKGVVQAKGLTDEKAARMLEGFRAGSTLRSYHVRLSKFNAYCDSHPDYAAEALPLLVTNRKAADQRKGRDRRSQTHCKRGHSLADAYVYISRGWQVRNCRTCHHMRNHEIKPLAANELQTVKSMLLARKSLSEIIGTRLRGKKRPVFVNSQKIYSGRKADPELERFVKEHLGEGARLARKLGWSLRKTHAATAERRAQTNDYHAIRAMIPAGVVDPDEIVASIFEDLLSGALDWNDIPRRVQAYVREREKVFSTKYRKFGDGLLVSLDERLFDDGSTTRGDAVSQGLWD